MSGGQLSVPVVVRMATGAGRQLAAQHSHSLEGWYAHIPGIKVLAPATPADARGLLLAAFPDPDPVFIFEHQVLYNTEGEVDEDAPPAVIGEALVRRVGTEVSLITYGGSLGKTLASGGGARRRRASTPRCSICARSGRSMWTRSPPASRRPTARWSSTRAGARAASPPR